MSQSQSDTVLYIWPSRWGLPSFDPLCLATVMYLQQTMPDKFSIVECSNPDISPTGQLPFLIHEQHSVSSFASIMKYIADAKSSGANSNLISFVDPTERSGTIAWTTHVESHLGNLIYYALYSHLDNWTALTHPVVASMFPVPQRYYVPGRIRESYRPRLEAAGLWNLHIGEKDEEKKKPFRETPKVGQREENSRKFLEAFGREKVADKARTLFGIYARLLGEKDFIHLDRPTTLDILIAAHMLLLLDPPYPDPFLKTILVTSYPTLASHARRVYTHLFKSSFSPLQVASTKLPLWRLLVPWPPVHPTKAKMTEKEAEEEMHYARMRWGFLGLALGSLAGYMVFAYKQAVTRRAVLQERAEDEGED